MTDPDDVALVRGLGGVATVAARAVAAFVERPDDQASETRAVDLVNFVIEAFASVSEMIPNEMSAAILRHAPEVAGELSRAKSFDARNVEIIVKGLAKLEQWEGRSE